MRANDFPPWSLRWPLLLVALAGVPSCSLVVGDLRVVGGSDDAAVDASVDVAVALPDLTTFDTAPPDLSLPCDPNEVADTMRGLFVSTKLGAKVGPGAANAPFDTLDAAIKEARKAGTQVIYIDEGVYQEFLDILDAPSGTVLAGGWTDSAGAWSRDCDPGARAKTIIASTVATGIRATSVTSGGGLRLEHLTVTNAAMASPVADMPGLSRIGVHVRGPGSLLSLFDVEVISSDADDGGAATKGASGAAPSCTGLMCAMGAVGMDGAPGADAMAAGMFAFGGFTPSDGVSGMIGGDGENGTAGDPATMKAGCFGDCACANNCGAPTAITVTVGAGKCGCGGKGGQPGKPGRGGGASVGVLAIGMGTTFTAQHSALTPGNGGDGSAGGIGGGGSTGTAGTPSAPGACHTGTCTATRDNAQVCLTCVHADGAGTVIPANKAGGAGGLGGLGGASGAGAGGPSYALVTANGATATLDGATTLTPGKGGASGGGSAPAGDSAPRTDQP